MSAALPRLVPASLLPPTVRALLSSHGRQQLEEALHKLQRLRGEQLNVCTTKLQLVRQRLAAEHRDALRHFQALETRCVALANSFFCSTGGQVIPLMQHALVAHCCLGSVTFQQRLCGVLVAI